MDGIPSIPVFADPVVAGKAGLDQAVTGAEAIGDDLGRQFHAPFDDGLQRCFQTVFHDLAMRPAAPFENAGHRHLAPVSPPAMAARAGRAETAALSAVMSSAKSRNKSRNLRSEILSRNRCRFSSATRAA